MCVNLNGTEGAHGIDNESLAAFRAFGGDIRQRVENACAGFAVHLRDMRNGRVGIERVCDHFSGRRLVLGNGQFNGVASEVFADFQDALAVGAVLRHQHLAVAGHDGADGRLDGKGTAALEWNADVGGSGIGDGEDVLAQAGHEGVEGCIPRSPVAQHRLLGGERGGHGPGGE